MGNSSLGGLLLEYYTRNTEGRDYAVGDIHGNFSGLQAALKAINFNEQTDRLFSVGDLVDRGPESHRVLEFLDLPWFHSVRGNHEEFCIRYKEPGVPDWHKRNGGEWFYHVGWDVRADISNRVGNLPLVMEVETSEGIVAIIHAESPLNYWPNVVKDLDNPATQEWLLWSRERIRTKDIHVVEGVRAVICGHTPIRAPVRYGNHYYIDTMGWKPDNGGYFTIIDLEDFEVLVPETIVGPPIRFTI